MAQFLRIRAWGRFQHYKDRDPPWIKLHRELLTSQTWVSLDDASRVLAIAFMLLAAGTDNKIPAEARYLKRVAYLNSEPDWRPLLEIGFIDLIDENGELASNVLASGTKRSSEAEERQSRAEERQSTTAAPPPTHRQVSRGTSAQSNPEWMLDFKVAYPNRAGDQGWRKALKEANARLAEGHTAAEFIAGALRYAEFCKAAGKTGTEYVKQACTFLGPDKPFLLPWHPPPRQLTATERILQGLNGNDDSRVIEHEPERKPIAAAR